MYRKVMSCVVAVVAVGSMSLSGCSLFGEDKFAVGDCVQVKDGITNDDLTKVECTKSGIADQLDGKTVYEVSEVLAYKESCPRGTDHTFDHEPHDATYCLNAY